MKIVINNKEKSYQAEVPKDKEIQLYGMKVGDTIDGSIVGAGGYMLEIRGGSDSDGFPMRSDLPGTGKRKIILKSAPGYRIKRKGMIKRKTIHGNTVSEMIAQLNTKVIESGPTSLEELFPKKEKEEKK